MALDIGYYFSIFLRRSPYFILLVALFSSVGLTVAMILPTEYEASATLLVEAEQIPENLASSTVSTRATEQLQIIEQRLMARETLLEVANRLNLYPAGPDGSRPPASDIVDDMRERVTFAQEGQQNIRRGMEGTTFLRISYRGKTAPSVAEVTNEFVTLVLQENLEIRTDQATDTLAFFRQEVDRLGGELDVQSVRLINFQNEVGLAVPENLSFLRSTLSDLQNQRSENRRTILELENQRRRLEDLFRVSAAENPAELGSPLKIQLAEAERELNNALLIYSPSNPRVSLLQARVAQLTEQVGQIEDTPVNPVESEAATGGFSFGDEPRTEREVRFAAELTEIDGRIAVLEGEIETITQEIGTIEAEILDVPSNGVALAKLQRDFENVQGQYNQAVERLSVAATGERIELLAKGQRISVVEQATAPDRPTKPNRPLIAAAGVGAGVFVGLAIIVLMEFLNRSIRRPVELTNRLGITPFAVLPYFRTQREIALRRLLIMGSAVGLVVVVPLALFAVHTFAYPLDTLIESLFNRVGLSVIG